MKLIFQAFDNDFDGEIDMEECYNGLTMMGVSDSLEATERIFRIADIDGDGTLKFKDWCNATMNK